MKQFMSKVRDLSQKAAEIKAAMQQVPPKVAEIREAVSATAGQLQQLKSQIEYSVADLRTNDENDLSAVLQEIGGSEEVLLKAGFALEGVDIELSPVQRLLVHLSKLEDEPAAVLRSLASSNQHRRSLHAILSALLQAQQMAETVELANLTYCEVIIGVGPIPSVRLCWRPEAVPGPVATALAAAVPVSAPAAAPTTQPAFGPGSFFEKRSATTEAAPAVVSAVLAEAVSPVASHAAAAVAVGTPAEPATEVSTDPLARFKKMPNLSLHKK
jgi:hypothetical protein